MGGLVENEAAEIVKFKLLLFTVLLKMLHAINYVSTLINCFSGSPYQSRIGILRRFSTFFHRLR